MAMEVGRCQGSHCCVAGSSVLSKIEQRHRRVSGGCCWVSFVVMMWLGSGSVAAGGGEQLQR